MLKTISNRGFRNTTQIDRAKVADVGLTVRDIAVALEGSVAGRQIGDFRPQGISVPIRMQLSGISGLTRDAKS